MKNERKQWEEAVRGPGKYEGQAPYVPYLWERDFPPDEDYGDTIGHSIGPEDIALFPELQGREMVWMYESDYGFVTEVDGPPPDDEEWDDPDGPGGDDDGLNEFLDSYLECALWASMDPDGEPLDRHHSVRDFAPSALASAIDDCGAFYTDHREIVRDDLGQAGHDFYLSRNGHGAGFFDGAWGKFGDELQRAAKDYGPADVYRGDDGKLYFFGG